MVETYTKDYDVVKKKKKEKKVFITVQLLVFYP